MLTPQNNRLLFDAYELINAAMNGRLKLLVTLKNDRKDFLSYLSCCLQEVQNMYGLQKKQFSSDILHYKRLLGEFEFSILKDRVYKQTLNAQKELSKQNYIDMCLATDELFRNTYLPNYIKRPLEHSQ